MGPVLLSGPPPRAVTVQRAGPLWRKERQTPAASAAAAASALGLVSGVLATHHIPPSPRSLQPPAGHLYSFGLHCSEYMNACVCVCVFKRGEKYVNEYVCVCVFVLVYVREREKDLHEGMCVWVCVFRRREEYMNESV